MPTRIKVLCSAVLVFGFALTTWAAVTIVGDDPQSSPPRSPPSPANYSKDRIEQLVAPIALYPDALLAQILMAATYPAEIAQAAYWLQGNPDLTPADMNFEMQGKPWDPSVKAMVAYAAVLYKLNNNLDWTRDLGNAVLGQQPAVLDAVQKLRAQANAAGNLASDQQQTVSVASDNIQIQPADPQQVYVPAYNPVTAYGSGWGYPTWYYPGVYNNYGTPWNYRNYGLYGNCDWRNHNLYVDGQRFRNLYQNDPQVRQDVNDLKQRVWQHDPDHRNGVPYHNPEIQNRYATQLAAERNNLNQFKGYHQTGASMPRNQNVSPAMPGNKLYASPAVQHLENQVATYHQGQGRMNALSGCANPMAENAARARGAYSRSVGGNYHAGAGVHSSGGGGGGHPGGGGGGHAGGGHR